MSEKEQLATMMLENMQRSDLTFYEQAQGFQLMMDLGETVESISEKTGLSKSTVRNRVKIAKYDKEIMRKASERQPTMEQYMKLGLIEDVEKANYVAGFLGTKDFDNEVGKAVKQQNEIRERNKIREIMAAFATKLEDASYNMIQELNLTSIDSFYTPWTDAAQTRLDKIPRDGTEYFYGEGYGFTVYRKKNKSDDDRLEEAREKRRKIDEFEDRAKKIYEAMLERAESFVQEYTRKDQYEILADTLFTAARYSWISNGLVYYGIARSLGWEYPDDLHTWDDGYRDEAEMYIDEAEEENKCRVMLHTLWITVSHGPVCYLPYNATKFEQYVNTHWMFLFGVLTNLGYNVSDEEWSYVNGSHPIYSEEVER
jgi:ParB family chromosome partitioning protein